MTRTCHRLGLQRAAARLGPVATVRGSDLGCRDCEGIQDLQRGRACGGVFTTGQIVGRILLILPGLRDLGECLREEGRQAL